MNLNGKEVNTRHCPYCGMLLNEVDYEMDVKEYGNIVYTEGIEKDDCSLLCSNSEISKNGKTVIRCSECKQILTYNTDEAKEFMTLLDTESDSCSPSYEPFQEDFCALDVLDCVVRKRDNMACIVLNIQESLNLKYYISLCGWKNNKDLYEEFIYVNHNPIGIKVQKQ